MSVKQNIQIWNLMRRNVILLLIHSLIIAIVFLGLAWLSGGLHIPAFFISAQSGNVPTELILDVQPVDAVITLGDRKYEREASLIPGEYVVKVSREGYYPVEESVRVHPGQENQFSVRLVPVTTIQDITQHAAWPGWDSGGNLYFFDSSEGKIYKWADGLQTVMADTIPGTYELVYSLDGTKAFTLVVPGPESVGRLYQIDLRTGETSDLAPATEFVLGADQETIWGISYDTDDNLGPVWSAGRDGALKPLSAENSEWAISGDQLAVDPSNQWLAIGGTKGVAVWEIATGKLLTIFDGASEPVWVQRPHPGLVFLGVDFSLNFARADKDWEIIQLLTNIHPPLASASDGSAVIFTRYNPFAGGTSVWAIDTTTMGMRLLSEAKIESGRIDQFAVSFDGKKIAFVNQENTLLLITLEP